IIDVPSPASRSIRRLTVSSGTGSEVLSYSLQYLQDRLQRRIGTRCARIGCFVESNPRDINLASRRSVENFFMKDRLLMNYVILSASRDKSFGVVRDARRYSTGSVSDPG